MFGFSSGSYLVWPRVIGSALIATGLLGILLSFAGMVFIASTAATARDALERELSALDEALLATSDGLLIAEIALKETRGTLESLSVTLVDATEAISQTQSTLSALQNLTGNELPTTIRETRQALDSARETARIADSILNALSFLGLEYNPDVPLSEALGTVSESLAPMPTDLAEVSSGVDVASKNIDELVNNLSDVAEGLDAIATSVDDSTKVVTQYKTVAAALKSEVIAVKEAAPGWITTIQWVLFLFLAWLGLAQIGVLAQGWSLLRRANDT